jgi:tetratricopeptide repeat protein 30
LSTRNYNEALQILENELSFFPESTPIHSLMGFCYWQLEDYVRATISYAKLVQLNPTNDSYKLHHAHCLYKTKNYFKAIHVSFVQSPESKRRAFLLQSAIRYAEGDIQSSKSLLEDSDVDILFDQACVLSHNDQFEEVLTKYREVRRVHGFIPEVVYYQLSRFLETVQMTAEIKAQMSQDQLELLGSLAGDIVDFHEQELIQKAKDAFLMEIES